MELEITVIHEAPHTRVRIRGEVSLGQLSSVLQVLEVDSAGWPRDRVVLDLRDVQGRFDAAEQALVGEIAQCRLRRKAVELLWVRAAR